MNDTELQELIDALNAFYSIYRWQPTTAHKATPDDFGDPIEVGEVYFTREVGVMERFRLSKRSMEHFLALLFRGGERLEQLGRHRCLKEQQEIYDVMQKVSIGDKDE